MINLRKFTIFDFAEEGDFIQKTDKLATDGDYIYFCSIKQGLFKVGTGRGGSIAGKVYHQNKEF